MSRFSFYGILYFLYTCFYLSSFILGGDVVLCDSGDIIHESINIENPVNKDNDHVVLPIIPKPSLLFRFKRKIC